MKKAFLLNLSVLLVLSLLLILTGRGSAFAQEATATPRPTFGPTCTPSPVPPTSTPALPVTAGSPVITSLVLGLGGLFLLGSSALLFLPLTKKLR